jgi:hypothetical protein
VPSRTHPNREMTDLLFRPVGLLSLLSEVTPYTRHFAQNAAMVFVDDLLRQSFAFGRKATVILSVSHMEPTPTVDRPRPDASRHDGGTNRDNLNGSSKIDHNWRGANAAS